MNLKTLQKAGLLVLSITLLIIAGWSGYEVHRLSNQRAQIKKDYSVINNITYGLLSVNAWRDHLVKVVTHRIDDFDFTAEQEVAMKQEIGQVLHALIDKGDSIMDRKQKTLGGKIKKFAVKALIDPEKIHARVPELSQTIVNEIKKPENKVRLKFLAQSKLQEFGTITYDSANDVNRIANVLAVYDSPDVPSFNKNSEVLLSGLQQRTYSFTFVLLGILAVFLLTWWMIRNQKHLHTLFYTMCVILALIVLITGLTTPMIEIDARIREMSFLLIGERISFEDQVIFFQSKSIVDVVSVLIGTGKFDSIAVGVLILAFSILFPIGKLLATKLYLLGPAWRANKVVQFFAFKSGKWSMADVNVVAIFMAYIGFKGILDSQMSNLNMKTESLASISTNETSLQPGFILFLCFVLFSLILSVILQKITVQEDPAEQTVKDKAPTRVITKPSVGQILVYSAFTKKSHV